jgi:hypothetical protein
MVGTFAGHASLLQGSCARPQDPSKILTANMPDPTSIKTDLLQASLSAYTAGYKVLADEWKNIDTKAQGTVAIAGVFLAGAFGFVKSLADRKPQMQGNVEIITSFCVASTNVCVAKQAIESLLLGSAVVALFAAVLLAVLTLRVRLIQSPSGDEVNKMARDAASLIGTPEEAEVPSRFIVEQRDLWHNAMHKTFEVYQNKAKHLARAQLAILAGATAVTILTLLEVFNR